MKLGAEKIRADRIFLRVLVSCPLASSSNAKPTCWERSTEASKFASYTGALHMSSKRQDVQALYFTCNITEFKGRA